MIHIWEIKMTETEVRTRTRAPIQRSTNPQEGRAPPQTQNDSSFMHRGQDAVSRQEEEVRRAQERREKGFAPYRYRLPANTRGDIIILDNDLGPCFYEHAIPGPGNDWSKTKNELCPKEYDACPLCASREESYWAMFMSVMDLRGYEAKKTGVWVPHSRKLLVVKTSQQPAFMRLRERAPDGNMRGMQLLMVRDSASSANIGTPELVTCHDEATLLQEFSHPEVKAQDGRVIKPANSDVYPYDYDQLFRRPTGEDLRRRWGGVAPAGSQQETQEAGWGGNDPGAAPAGGGIQRTAPPDGAGSAVGHPDETPPASGGGIQRTAGPAAGPSQETGSQQGSVLPDDSIPF